MQTWKKCLGEPMGSYIYEPVPVDLRRPVLTRARRQVRFQLVLRGEGEQVRDPGALDLRADGGHHLGCLQGLQQLDIGSDRGELTRFLPCQMSRIQAVVQYSCAGR